MFSRRTSWSREPNAWALASTAARRRPDVLDLTVTDPTRVDLERPDPLPIDLRATYDPHPFGAAKARAEVARYYEARGRRVAPEQIVLAATTSEAYGWLFRLVADVGERVAAPTPSYPLFAHLADASDVVLAPYPLAFDGRRFRIDDAALADVDARALLVVSPNNPTGNVLSESERAQIVAWCREHDAALIVDEVFLDSVAPPVSYAGRGDVLSFTLGGLSKAAALPGAKLSWIVVGGPMGPMEEALARLEIIADTALSVGAPVQAALGAVFAAADRTQASLRRRLERNRAAAMAFGALPIEGGWSAILPVGEDDEALALRLLDRGVIAQPGYLYDLSFEALVVSTIVPCATFEAGLAKIRDTKQ